MSDRVEMDKHQTNEFVKLIMSGRVEMDKHQTNEFVTCGSRLQNMTKK